MIPVNVPNHESWYDSHRGFGDYQLFASRYCPNPPISQRIQKLWHKLRKK